MFTMRLLKIKIHSRRVFVFKRFLPIFAFLFASLIIAWPTIIGQKDDLSLALPIDDISKPSYDSAMEKVRFFSSDNRQNPFAITASSVQETDSDKKIIKLFNPLIVYQLSSEAMITIDSPYGLAFQNDKYLYLDKKVHAVLSTGYDAIAKKVVCDYNEDSIYSESPVFIKGIGGLLNAQGFKTRQKVSLVDFTGNIHLVMFQQEVGLDKVAVLDNTKIDSYFKNNPQNVDITAENGLYINQQDKTFTFDKNVVLKNQDTVLNAEKAIATYEKKSGKNTLLAIRAYENIILTTPEHTATGDKMQIFNNSIDIAQHMADIYKIDTFKNAKMPTQLIILSKNAKLVDKSGSIKADTIYALYQTNENNQSQLDSVYVINNVKATNNQQIITGKYGVYTPKNTSISLYENVQLQENNTKLNAEKATLNLTTGVSQLLSQPSVKSAPSTKSRVKGTLIPSEVKQ